MRRGCTGFLKGIGAPVNSTWTVKLQSTVLALCLVQATPTKMDHGQAELSPRTQPLSRIPPVPTSGTEFRTCDLGATSLLANKDAPFSSIKISSMPDFQRSVGESGSSVDMPSQDTACEHLVYDGDPIGRTVEDPLHIQDERKTEDIISMEHSTASSVTGDLGSEDGVNAVAPPKKKRTNRKQGSFPNAFVSIRVPSPHIKEQLGMCQEEMVRAEPALHSTMVSLEKLHLTLMVLRLDTEEQEERAKALLVDITDVLKRNSVVGVKPLLLEFSGVGHFGGNVVFVKVKDSPAKDKLHQIADLVRDGFSRGGLPSTDNRSFKSHLTVAKMSAGDRRTLWRGIPEHSYASFLDRELGEQVMEGLELLSMSKPADEEGYYYCFKKCPFISE